MELGKAIQFNPPERIAKGEIVKKIAMEKLTPFEKKIRGFEMADYSAGPKFRNGDTLVAKITPCLENGKTAQVDILDDGEVAFGSSEFIVLRSNGNSIQDYIFYLAKSPAFRKKAISCMEGTSGRKRVNEGALKLQVLPIPDTKTQQKIASVLSSLDSKIEINNRINRGLEQMAKRLYDYWFVQFEFPFDLAQGKPDPKGKPYKTSGGKMVWNEQLKREIPEGWEVKDLSEVTSSIMRGISPKYMDEGGICVLNQKCIRDQEIKFEFGRRHDHELKSASSKLIQYGDVLVNSTGFGTLGRVAIVKWLQEQITAVDSHITIVRCENESIKKLFLGYSMLMRQREIEGLAEGSTGQTELSRVNLGQLKMVIPPIELQSRFERFSEPLIQKMAINESENQQLASLRDWLLPMLMNGQVTVGDGATSKPR